MILNRQRLTTTILDYVELLGIFLRAKTKPPQILFSWQCY
jgi:hypothetical protein